MNEKTLPYGTDDGQYRINFDNETSFNPPNISEGFESATRVEGTTYVVEAKIPWKELSATANTIVGFDIQLNDAAGGSRKGVAAWNDSSGQGYNDPSVFGEIKLLDPNVPDPGTNPGTNPGTGTPVESSEKPVVTVINGKATVNVSADLFKQLLSQATLINGQKQVVIEIDNEGVHTSSIVLPKSSLNSNEIYTIKLKTPQGTLEIPSSMLSNVLDLDAENVTIEISSVNSNELDEKVQQQIGNRPVVKLHVIANGKIIKWNNPNAAITVSLPYEPTAAELDKLDHILVWYIAEDGQITTLKQSRYDATNKAVRFQTTHFSTFAVSYVVKSFDDLGHVPWATKAIEVMASRQIINGVSDHAYNPADNIKRADFISLLVRALELKGTDEGGAVFNDVKETDYFFNEVKIAKQLGIAAGTGNNVFNPHESITRQDAMLLVVNAMAVAGVNLTEGSLDEFSDANQVADYAKSSTAALVKSGIVNGDNGKLLPKEGLTRAQAAVILYRIWNY